MAIPLPTGLRAAYRAERAAQDRPRKPRTPLLVHLGRAAGKLAGKAQQARTAALSVAGFGFVDYAAFEANHIAGYAAVGVSLLVLEWLTTGSSQ